MDTDLTIKDAAEALGVHPRTMRRYVKQGRVHWTMIRGQFGEEYRISRQSIEQLSKGGVPTAQPLVDAGGLSTVDIVNRLDEQAKLIEALRQEVAGLRENLLLLLPAAPPEVEEEPEPAATTTVQKTPWWRRLWRGKDAS